MLVDMLIGFVNLYFLPVLIVGGIHGLIRMFAALFNLLWWQLNC